MAILSATDLKNGTTFLLDGKPYKVAKYTFQKIGRGGANVKVSVRNLETGSLEEKSFNSTAKVESISTSKRNLQYLYQDGAMATFMDPQTYEQVEMPLRSLGNDIYYLKEGENADIMFLGDKPLSVDLPPKITLSVTETAPGVKGNSATNIYKPAILSNGLTVKVPLFIKEGDSIRVDTRSGEYVERAN